MILPVKGDTFQDYMAACKDAIDRHVRSSLWCWHSNLQMAKEEYPPFVPVVFLNEHRKEVSLEHWEPKREPRRCINNSFDLVLDLRHKGKDAHYFEGYLLMHEALCTPHAVVELDGRFYDPTLPSLGGMKFFGVRVPTDLFIECAMHECWECCCGCFETMAYFNDEKLLKAQTMLKEANRVK